MSAFLLFHGGGTSAFFRSHFGSSPRPSEAIFLGGPDCTTMSSTTTCRFCIEGICDKRVGICRVATLMAKQQHQERQQPEVSRPTSASAAVAALPQQPQDLRTLQALPHQPPQQDEWATVAPEKRDSLRQVLRVMPRRYEGHVDDLGSAGEGTCSGGGHCKAAIVPAAAPWLNPLATMPASCAIPDTIQLGGGTAAAAFNAGSKAAIVPAAAPGLNPLANMPAAAPLIPDTIQLGGGAAAAASNAGSGAAAAQLTKVSWPLNGKEDSDSDDSETPATRLIVLRAATLAASKASQASSRAAAAAHTATWAAEEARAAAHDAEEARAETAAYVEKLTRGKRTEDKDK